MPSFEEEAFNRARQMHQGRRTSNPANSAKNYAQTPEPQPEMPAEQKNPDNNSVTEIPIQPAQQKSGGITEILFQNKEQSLILMLLILLMEENTEPTLLLALVYLLI